MEYCQYTELSLQYVSDNLTASQGWPKIAYLTVGKRMCVWYDTTASFCKGCSHEKAMELGNKVFGSKIQDEKFKRKDEGGMDDFGYKRVNFQIC